MSNASPGLTAYLARPLIQAAMERRCAMALDKLRYRAVSELASYDEMRDAGWAMDYDYDGYGRLFGRWAEGGVPPALVPFREGN